MRRDLVHAATDDGAHQAFITQHLDGFLNRSACQAVALCERALRRDGPSRREVTRFDLRPQDCSKLEVCGNVSVVVYLHMIKLAGFGSVRVRHSSGAPVLPLTGFLRFADCGRLPLLGAAARGAAFLGRIRRLRRRGFDHLRHLVRVFRAALDRLTDVG